MFFYGIYMFLGNPMFKRRRRHVVKVQGGHRFRERRSRRGARDGGDVEEVERRESGELVRESAF